MSTLEIAEIVAVMTEMKAKTDQTVAEVNRTVAEVNRVSAAQDLLAADATPGQVWVNDKLAANQATQDVVAQKIMDIDNGSTTALDEMRSRRRG